MDDLTQLNIKDMYTGKLVRVSTREELTEWLNNSYATITQQQRDMIDCLEEALETDAEGGIKWYGAACSLIIEPKKKTRRKTK